MSVLAVLRSASTGVMVMADTDAWRPEQRIHVDADKLFVLPTMGAVLAGRGIANVILGVYGALTTLPQDMDIVAPLMPELLQQMRRQTHAALAERIGAAGAAHHGQGLDLLLAGWSEAERQMVVHAWHPPEGLDAQVEARTVGHRWAAPYDAEIEPQLKAMKDMPSMVTLGRAQVALLRNRCGQDCAAGGHLMVAHLMSRDVIMVQRAFTFDDRLRPRAAAPAAEAA